MDILNSINIIIAGVYVLFLPGFAISFIFFERDKIEWIERVALSFALSISVIPLITFYANLLGFSISKQSVILEVLIVLLLSVVILYIKYFVSLFRKDKNTIYKKRRVSISVEEAKSSSNRFGKIHIVAQEAFQIFLVTYLCLLLLETIKIGFVSYFFNLNILLIIVLVSGVAMVLTHSEKKKNIIPAWSLRNLLKLVDRERLQPVTPTIGKWDKYYIYLLSLGGGVLVYYKTEELGLLSILLTVVTIVIIFLLSYLIFTENES